MKDTLEQALIRIDRLQTQVDSLKSIKTSYSPAIVEQRLGQASDTISNLSSLSTGFGTMYTVIGVIVAILTIGVPFWLNKKTDVAIEGIDNKFNDKLLSLQQAYKNEIKKLNLAFNQKFESLSQTNSLEIQQMNLIFQEKADELKKDYLVITRRIEANLFVVISELFHDKGDKTVSCVFAMLSADVNLESQNHETSLVNLSNFLERFRELDKTQRDLVDKHIKGYREKNNIQEFINSFKNSEAKDDYIEIIKSIELELGKYK